MRKIRSFKQIRWGLLLLLLLCIDLCVYAQEINANAPGQTQMQAASSLTIAVGTDLHVDPENRYAGVINPLVTYNIELTRAFLEDVQAQDADLLLLCGDITNGGREVQHQALIRELEKARKAGLPIYVLPGNHDLGDITQEQFAKLYADFGYRDAYSRDTDSLSYSILIGDLLILMLDTDGYSGRTGGAYVSEKTLAWIRSQLELAKQNHWEVLSAGHYSLLTGQTTEFIGQEEMTALLEAYDVPLYLCGHLHQRSVALSKVLTELVVEQMISSPCGYALLSKVGYDHYRYQPRLVDVAGWAKRSGVTDPNLLGFQTHVEKIFREKSREVIKVLNEGQKVSPQEERQAIEFFRIMQKSYACGELYQYLEELYAHPGYPAFTKISEGTTYGKWIPIIMESAVPYTIGFELKSHEITLINE